MPKRTKYLIIAALLFIAEFAIAYFLKTGFIRHVFGDFLVVILMYCFLQVIALGPVFKMACIALAIAFFVEFLQAVSFLSWMHWEDKLWARLVFGTSFSWGDILAYSLGIGFVLVVENLSIFKNSRCSKN